MSVFDSALLAGRRLNRAKREVGEAGRLLRNSDNADERRVEGTPWTERPDIKQGMALPLEDILHGKLPQRSGREHE